MASLGFLVVGVVLLVVVIVDLTWTTLWVEGGAGPLTSRLMAWTWRGLRRVGRGRRGVLTLSGPLILVVGFAAWTSLLWAGWTLFFAGTEAALLDTVGGGGISWVDRLYFTGYAMFTLGNGDLVPNGDVWQVATVLVTASGMLYVTLAVTYVLSVLDAVTQKRAFASGVSGLGPRGEDVLRTAWNGEEFQGLDLLLNTYVEQLNALTSNHKAYPILHYYYSERVDRSPVTSVAILEDALSLLAFGVPEGHRPSDAIIENARSSVDGYLETLEGSFVEPAADAPPPPDLGSLEDAGIPTTSEQSFASALDGVAERRRTLLGLVELDVRRWPSGDDD